MRLGKIYFVVLNPWHICFSHKEIKLLWIVIVVTLSVRVLVGFVFACKRMAWMVLRRWKRCLSTFTDVKVSSNIDSFLVLLTFTGTLLPTLRELSFLLYLSEGKSGVSKYCNKCFGWFWPYVSLNMFLGVTDMLVKNYNCVWKEFWNSPSLALWAWWVWWLL